MLRLQKRELIKVLDAAPASWPAEAGKPKQLHDQTGAGALSGTFRGTLFVLNAAVGTAAGALGGKMADVGIDDDFIDSSKAKVTPGASALFLLSQDAMVERAREAFPGGHTELIHSNLDSEKKTRLREDFANQAPHAPTSSLLEVAPQD